ncbi:hypothetical protein GCM10009745_02800 [Kribbella yunnanensis]|uniref:Uncharacterized protein n=1 Tax=Kribbella yunnanensis TaxID=190194 RepID=A0ABP4S0Y2_9ACTN
MNLQDLRRELDTRAEESAARQPDLLPGIHNKIRRTKQRRTATALASVAAIAALAVAVVPGVLNTSTPDPAENVPQDYIQNGKTVPGMVNGDKLLKAWVGDPSQNKVSFAWIPTTTKISIYASCDSAGYAVPKEVRVWIGDWYAGSAPCRDGSTESETLPLGSFEPTSALWLDAPVGKATTVTAQVVGTDSGKPDTVDQLQLGIYAAADAPAASDAAPTRVPAVGPDDFQSGGIVYRKHFGGDTLLGATVGQAGQKQVSFSFTSTGAPLVLHEFCSANKGIAGTSLPPYQVATSLNGTLVSEATCGASSTDAVAGTSHGVASPPAGQRVDVTSQIVPVAGKQAPPLPADVRLGVGVYSQGKQRSVDGVGLAERIELGGYEYRLADIRQARGPAGKVAIDTPADQPFVIVYGSSKLGIAGPAEGEMSCRERATGISVAAAQHGDLGRSLVPFAAGPPGQAEMKVTKGKPTKGTVFIGIYLPV